MDEDEDDRFEIVKGLLFSHVCNLSQRHVRDAWAIHLLAKEIVERLDHRTGVWRKWTEEREALVRSAINCWIPVEDMRAYLNGMPGSELTRMDVAQRSRAFQEERHEAYPDKELQPGCLTLFEQEKAEGTELPAIVGAIQEWVEQEEERQWREREAARQRGIEEERVALEERLLGGADCKWTPVGKSAEIYCRKNGRTYRLTPTDNRMWDLHRISSVEDQGGALVGTYRARGDATKAVASAAWLPEPRW